MAFKFILLRHAHAGTKEKFKKKFSLPDSKRPISARGRREMKDVLKAIMRLVPNIDLILSSDLMRAEQTAHLLNKKYRKAKYQEILELRPNSHPRELIKKMKAVAQDECVAVVGHEPHLSRLLSFILTGADQTDFDIKKGGFAIVEFYDQFKITQARLMCLVQPSRLKQLKK